jgi:hypothetical protein
MIIVKIIGGLGNQLFQYATGRAVANFHGLKLKLDIAEFETYKLHNGYRLDHFDIDAEVASKEEIMELKGAHFFLLTRLRRAGLFKRNTYFIEKKSSHFDSRIFANRNIYLDGYWQNELYFKDIRNLLVKELKPEDIMKNCDQSYLKRIRCDNAVSIHVRRGDYLQIKGIGVLGIDYYKAAIDYIKTYVQKPNFFVFSDDLIWCKNSFDFLENCTFVENSGSEIFDMMLMSECNHNIIANSSFSWWAAWLNDAHDKIVVAPNGWRLDDPGSENIISSDWVRI